jgi:hypothetical protein
MLTEWVFLMILSSYHLMFDSTLSKQVWYDMRPHEALWDWNKSYFMVNLSF